MPLRITNPYRLFHLSARLHLRNAPSPAPPPTHDDYYTLLLESPTPTPIKQAINPPPTTNTQQPPSSTNPPPPSSPSTSTTPPDPKVLFSTPLAGPSARMCGLARAENDMGRPPEPDNCCMSGCVNCVWDAYREEIEEWAAARRRRDGGKGVELEGGRRGGAVGAEGVQEGAVGNLEDGFVGDIGVGGEEDMFEGVPVGIKEFMRQEKRLRERREGRREVG